MTLHVIFAQKVRCPCAQGPCSSPSQPSYNLSTSDCDLDNWGEG